MTLGSNKRASIAHDSKKYKDWVSIYTRLEWVANDSLPQEAHESPKMMMPLQETTWVLRRAIAEWAALARRAELAYVEGKCALAGILPIAYSGGGAPVESTELAFAAVAADAANAAGLAQSSLWFTCIDKRSADKANSY